MIEVIYALTFGDNKKTGINSHSKEGVTQKNAHKQRALTKYKKIQDIFEKSSSIKTVEGIPNSGWGGFFAFYR